MDTIFTSFAKKAGNNSLSNKRNFPCFIEMKTYFSFHKSHPINPTMTELALDERDSNYDNCREFLFAANRLAEKGKSRIKSDL